MFVDRVKVYVKGGDGGNGAVSFLREKYVPHGGPDGGDGGRGGNVIFQVDPGLRTLLDFKYRQHLKAPRGQHGRGKARHGKGAPDLVVKVPPGTVVYDQETGQPVVDLTRPGEKAVIARAGRGGKGNARFASSRNKAPGMAEKGEPGEERQVILELKLMAEVGLAGFPNAGKSTFLARVSAARPKIDSYPFTTLVPNLGEVRLEPGRSFVVADIPGIIQGAHQGAGLGLQFLRHIQRTRILLVMLDAAETEGRDVLEDYGALQRELALYRPGLDRPGDLPGEGEQGPGGHAGLGEKMQVVAANKIDLPRGRENLERIRQQLSPRYRVFGISAVTGEGIKELLYYLGETLDGLGPALEAGEGARDIVYKPREEDVLHIEQEGRAFTVRHKGMERMVHMTDFDNQEAVDRLMRFLESRDIEGRLKERGIKEGDLVRIGPMEFTFQEGE